MKVFIEINILKSFHSHISIFPILRELLIGFKLPLPLLLTAWIPDIQRLPLSHAEARLRESGVAAQADHEEHGSSGHQQPRTNKPFFTRDYKRMVKELKRVRFETLGG
jgi:hypothetical protein